MRWSPQSGTITKYFHETFPILLGAPFKNRVHHFKLLHGNDVSHFIHHLTMSSDSFPLGGSSVKFYLLHFFLRIKSPILPKRSPPSAVLLFNVRKIGRDDCRILVAGGGCVGGKRMAPHVSSQQLNGSVLTLGFLQ